jgi:Lrp/AsnC family transcriptional regulator, leucine-responsive regulatory protein
MTLIDKLTVNIEGDTVKIPLYVRKKMRTPLQNDREIDSVGWQLLRMLQENARSSFRQIGEAIGMTAPAVGERVHRLEDAGILKGYRADIDLAKLGRPIMAFVHLTCDSHQETKFRVDVLDILDVMECHCVTGIESFILKVAVTSVPHLEQLLTVLKNYGNVRTSVVLSAQVTSRVIDEHHSATP